MRSLLHKWNLPTAVAAVLLAALGLGAVMLDTRLYRDAEAAGRASFTMKAAVLELLEFGRLAQEFPQALGTASEEPARDRLRTALQGLGALPAELAAIAASARETGNAVLAETAARTRAEIQADLLILTSAVDRMIAHDTTPGAIPYLDRTTALLLERMLPELTRPQMVLDAEQDRLDRRRRDLLAVELAVAAALALGMVACALPALSRAERRRLQDTESALEKAAFTDAVTGLPNQRATHRFLESLPAGQPVLIMVFEIVPAFGLPDGDETQIAIGVAAAVGRRLQELETDALYLGQAREGRFCMVLSAQEAEQITYAQHRDLESLADEPVQLDHRRVRLVFRAGVAVRRPNRPALAALDNASIALDKARELRALQPMTYRPEFRRETIADQRLAQEFRVALMSGEVRPYFQPQIDLRSGAVTGMEALARWHHPRRGLLPPGAFLPQAQRTGLDEPLGEVMLRLGLEALRAWDERGLQVPGVGINAAASQLNNPRFYDFVRWELDRQRIAPERLAIEVLENIYAPSDDDPIARNLRKLARLGVRIDMDDFGTGATSVTGMRRYHATRIKIDRSYVRDLDKTTSNQTLVSTMVQMARNLDIESLAEGVETPAERAWLARIGCDHIQGYGVARPMPLADTFDWLAQHQAALPRASGQQG